MRRHLDQQLHGQPGDHQEGGQLDQRFEADGQNHAPVMHRGIDGVRAEQNRKHSQDECQPKAGIDTVGHDARHHRADPQGIVGTRNRLYLQRDVGQGSDQRDDRHQRRDLVALAVTGGDEIRDRGGLLALTDINQLAEEGMKQQEDQDRSQVDGEKGQAMLGGIADRAEEGPGSAVDRQRQGVDQRLVTHDPATGLPVPPVGDIEQYRQVEGGNRDDDLGGYQGAPR